MSARSGVAVTGALGAAMVAALALAAPASASPSTSRSAEAPPPASADVVKPECTITGTPRRDILTGTPGDDVICGLGGNDVIRGLGGNDLLIGGAGRDQIFGGAGDDALTGGRGADRLTGGLGEDTCASAAQDRTSSDCAIDSAVPEISNLTVPTTVTAGESITITWRATDESGVAGTYVHVGGRQGWATWCFGQSARLVSGDARDGTYSVTCAVPATVINDVFEVWLGAYDALGNGGGSTDVGSFVTTGGSNDLGAPLLSDVTFDPVVRAGESIVFTFRLQDETGLGFATAFLRGPGGIGSPIIWLYTAPLERISGDERDGVYRLELPTSPDAVITEYEAWLWFGDSVNNREVIPIGSVTIERG